VVKKFSSNIVAGGYVYMCDVCVCVCVYGSGTRLRPKLGNMRACAASICKCIRI